MDVPEDIRKTARAAEERYGDGTLSLSDAFALAVMTERERCAKIAEDYPAFGNRAIANAIRRETVSVQPTDITVRNSTESEQNAGETGYKHE